MAKIEENLKAFCRAKGLTLTDVANRIGTSPSNLVNRVKGNPTISTIEDIAAALNVSVSELLTNAPEKAQGIAIIGGQTYQLSAPSATAVQLPAFERYDDARAVIESFVKSCVKKEEDSACMGMLEAFEIFSLYYDHHSAKFLLSVCYGAGNTLTIQYDKIEFANWKETDTEDSVKWNLADITQEIVNDIEGAVLARINAE